MFPRYITRWIFRNNVFANPGERCNYCTLLLRELITLVDFTRAQRRRQRSFRDIWAEFSQFPTVSAQLFYFHDFVIISICECYLVTSFYISLCESSTCMHSKCHGNYSFLDSRRMRRLWWNIKIYRAQIFIRTMFSSFARSINSFFLRPFCFRPAAGANASNLGRACCAVEIFLPRREPTALPWEIPERRRRQRARWINHASPTRGFTPRNFDDPTNIAGIMDTRVLTHNGVVNGIEIQFPAARGAAENEKKKASELPLAIVLYAL